MSLRRMQLARRIRAVQSAVLGAAYLLNRRLLLLDANISCHATLPGVLHSPKPLHIQQTRLLPYRLMSCEMSASDTSHLCRQNASCTFVLAWRLRVDKTHRLCC
ncbi:hypothetical protein TRVL_10376 [Trypanosoma vivax]|nr:hypothetical protein TRVL_10376 [Trypanosoma vivax]